MVGGRERERVQSCVRRSIISRRRAVRCARRLGWLLPALWLAASGCGAPSTRDPGGKANGRKVYAAYCAGCHGEDGRRSIAGMRLAESARRDRDELRAVVLNGRRGMPRWRDTLRADEIDAVVDYTRTLQPSAAPAAPRP